MSVDAQPGPEGGSTVGASDRGRARPELADATLAADLDAAPVRERTLKDWIGETIEGRYRLREMLGEGGMGAVYVATHLTLGTDVAVKIIRPMVARDGTMGERFRREAMATAQIDNPHVVKAIDFGKLADGSDFFVLQLVQGPTFAEFIAGGAREWTWVCEIGEQIADALAATHRLGIIHRDLKPGNVIVSERGDGRPHVFVLDFGIARVSEGLDRLSASDRQPLTRAGAVLGTPGYMSPEQFSGDVVDGRADLYALGVMLWECLAGRRLWTGDTMAVQFTKQLRGELPPLAELAPDTPAPLIELITALLARSPSARPQTAEEVRQRLAELIAVARASGAHPSILTSGAHRVSGPAPRAALATVATLAQSAGAAARDVARKLPRGRLAWIVGGGLGLLLLIIVLASSGADDPEPAPTKAPAVAAKPTKAPTKAAPDDEPDEIEEPEPEATDSGDTPRPLLSAFHTIAKSSSDGRRKKAAKEIREWEPKSAVPAYIRLAAELQMAERCDEKKVVVEAFGALKDPRGLPALQRYEPRGFHACGRRDCYGCMRAALATAIRAMGAEPARQTLEAIGE